MSHAANFCLHANGYYFSYFVIQLIKSDEFNLKVGMRDEYKISSVHYIFYWYFQQLYSSHFLNSINTDLFAL